MIPERLQPVLDAVAPLADRFAAADHRLFLVGGIVRDLFVGRDLVAERDIDLTTDARPDQIKALLEGQVDALWTQGERFGTIGAKVGDWTVEITTHRAEVYVPDSRKPEVQFSDEVRSDLSRRDFTVNAMALALPELELIDPFDGADDLAAGRLRTPLSQRSPSATTPCACSAPRASSPATASRPNPRSSGRWSRCGPGSTSSRPSASATSSTS